MSKIGLTGWREAGPSAGEVLARAGADFAPSAGEALARAGADFAPSAGEALARAGADFDGLRTELPEDRLRPEVR